MSASADNWEDTTQERFLRQKLGNFAVFAGKVLPAARKDLGMLCYKDLPTIFHWVSAYLLPNKVAIYSRDDEVIHLLLKDTGHEVDTEALDEKVKEKFFQYLEFFLEFTGIA